MVTPVRTTHIQHILRQALQLAEEVDGKLPATVVEGQLTRPGAVTVDQMVARAANLAEHAAAELRDEAFTSIDWPT